MKYNFILLILIIFQYKDICESLYEYETNCDIHIADSFDKTPQHAIHIDKIEDNWLHPTEEQILHYYHIGMKECNSYLEKNKDLMKNSKYPNPDLRSTSVPISGQKLCRGVNMLYGITGTILYPFGPIMFDDCPTYRKCWYGLLTCGTPNIESITKVREKSMIDHTKIMKERTFKNDSYVIRNFLPKFNNWSIKSVRVHMRIDGIEIIVPEQRLKSIKIPNSDEITDVIIAQYTMINPSSSYKLELRIEELYTGILFDWNSYEKEKLEVDVIGTVYLGGSESRCKPWTGRCYIHSECCGCDDATFISNSNINLNVPNGLDKCPKTKKYREDLLLPSSKIQLPLCSAGTSYESGRWIRTQDPMLCNINEKSQWPIFPKVQLKNWWEASGDPCQSRHQYQEFKNSPWTKPLYMFFAPYRCKYHFYTLPEMKQCLKDKGINHIHFTGDSMSRDLFSFITRYLNVSSVDENKLKMITNELKEKNIELQVEDILISEGNSWDYNLETLNLVLSPPYPQVIVTNYGLGKKVYVLNLFI